MKVGCQDHLLHRLRGEKPTRGERFSLSFNRMIPEESVSRQLTSTSETSSQVHRSDSSGQTVNSTGENSVENSKQNAANLKRLRPKVRKTNVLYGTSITKYVQTKNFSFRGKNPVKVSQNGANIKDITANIKNFYADDPAAKNNDDEKIILNIGTNDVEFPSMPYKDTTSSIYTFISNTYNHTNISYNPHCPSFLAV